MNRRERHENIILNWCGHWGERGLVYDRNLNVEVNNLIRRRGFAALTDEAIEDLARNLVTARSYSRKLREKNQRRATS